MALIGFLGFSRVYNAPAATANYSVAVPPGVADVGGDVVLLAFVRRSRLDTLTPVVPTMSGWTSANGAALTSTERIDSFYRLSVPAEPANYVIQTGSPGGIQEAVILAYTSAYPVGAGSTFVGTSNPASTALVSHNYSPTVLDQLAVTLWSAHSAPVINIASSVIRVKYGEEKFVLSDKTIASLTANQTSLAETMVGNAANFTSTFLLTPFNRPPFKPTLIYPVSGASADMAAAGSQVSWTYSDPDGPLDPQSAFRLKRTPTAPSGAAQWWTGSAWTGSETAVTSTAHSVTFAANKWTNGTVYTWSVDTADLDGTWGPYSDLNVVNADTTPTVSVDGPVPLITDTTRPTVSWTYTQAEGNPQIAYEVKVFTLDVATAAGFDPTTSPSATWSVAGVGTADMVDVAVDLTNNTAFRAYVRAAQRGDLWSAWASSDFLLALEVPPPPTLTASDFADEVTGISLVRLEAVSHHNLLTADQGVAVAAELVNRVGTAVDVIPSEPEGTEVTTSAAGQVAVQTATETAVSGGGPYTVSAEFAYDNSTTSPRNVAVGVVAYDDAGAEIGTFLVPFALENSEGEPPPPPPPTPPAITIFLSTSPDRSNPIPIGSNT
jgi:hypothetical protein